MGKYTGTHLYMQAQPTLKHFLCHASSLVRLRLLMWLNSMTYFTFFTIIYLYLETKSVCLMKSPGTPGKVRYRELFEHITLPKTSHSSQIFFPSRSFPTRTLLSYTKLLSVLFSLYICLFSVVHCSFNAVQGFLCYVILAM